MVKIAGEKPGSYGGYAIDAKLYVSYVTRGLQQRHADLGLADAPPLRLALIH